MSNTQNPHDPRGTGGAAAREMALIHRILRREFSSLRQMIVEVPAADAGRMDAIAGHLKFMLDGLQMRHTAEDDLVWPLLLERAGNGAPHVRRMEQQHRDIDTAVARVHDAVTTWASDPYEASAAELLARLDAFLAVTENHLDDEERDIVPLIDRHLNSGEWENVGQQESEGFTPSQRWIVLGQLLEVASPEEAEMMFDRLPLPVRLLWPLVGRRTYRRYIESLRGG